MKIVAIEKLEDCFDGSRVYRYRFDHAWLEPDIQRLNAFGSLQYFPDFPRPFFRLHTSSGMQITGVGNDHACRVVYPKQNQDQLKRELANWLCSYR